MANLFFPNPAGPSSLPLHPPALHDTGRRVPPANFNTGNLSAARAAARVLREPSSPFVPKRNQGKEKDLSALSIDQLTAMLEANAQLLDTPSITAALPGGDSKLRTHQTRISTRLQELKEVRQLRSDLATTHLNGDGDEAGDDMQVSGHEGIDSTSPRTKLKIISAHANTSPNSLTSAMSFRESLELQRQAVERRRLLDAKRDQMELDSQRSQATGGKLQAALAARPEMAGFMFHADSAEEDEDEDFDLDPLESEQQRLEEEADDESALNPYRAAFESGYNRDLDHEAG